MPGKMTPFVRDGERWLCPLGGLVAEVQRGALRIYQQNGTAVGHFPLAPRVNGGATTLAEWHDEEGVLTAQLVERDIISVQLWSMDGRIHYRLNCLLHDPVDLTYFPGSTFRGPQWQTFVPDAQDRAWPKGTPHTITVSTAVDQAAADVDRSVLTPQPRACALQYDEGWLAVLAPRALPVAATAFSVDKAEHFQITFMHYLAPNAGNHGPEVVFADGLNEPYEALDELARLAKAAGETHGPMPAAPWWIRPLFCTWGEQMQRAPNINNARQILSADLVRETAKILRDKLGTADFNIIIDLQWFEYLGDYTAHPATFGGEPGLRALIDELHAAGHKVLLWLAPFALDRNAQVVAANRPEGMLRIRSSEQSTNPEFLPVRDFTHPRMREQYREVVHRLLNPNGLNADGLKLYYLYECPDPRNLIFHDPSWASGDQLWAKVLALTAEAARAAKPEALLTISSAMPYLQHDAGAILLNDNLTRSPLPWWQRARVVSRAMPGTLIDTGGWALFPQDAAAHWMTAPVYGIPSLYHATMLDERVPMTDADYRRLAAAWMVYANAPVWNDQRVVVEPEQDLFERYYPDGTLAAKSHGNMVLVTISPQEIRACAADERVIELPLTDQHTVREAQLATTTGDTLPLNLGDLRIRPLKVTVPDAGVDGQYVRVLLET